MVFEQYNDFRIKFLEAQKNYDLILQEKEGLFNRTQPKSTDYDKERVAGGNPVNSFDEYLIQKEKNKIDERLFEASSILEDRRLLLTLKYNELKESKELIDLIYKLYFLDNLSTYKIAKKINLDQSNVWRYLAKIKKRIKTQ